MQKNALSDRDMWPYSCLEKNPSANNATAGAHYSSLFFLYQPLDDKYLGFSVQPQKIFGLKSAICEVLSQPLDGESS